MQSGLSDTNPIIVAAFKAALLHQGLLIMAVLVLLALTWAAARARRFRRVRPSTALATPGGSTARRVLRIGFGVHGWVALQTIRVPVPYGSSG